MLILYVLYSFPILFYDFHMFHVFPSCVFACSNPKIEYDVKKKSDALFKKRLFDEKSISKKTNDPQIKKTFKKNYVHLKSYKCHYFVKNELVYN